MKFFTGEWFADNAIMTSFLDDVKFYSGTERKKILKVSPLVGGSMLYGTTWRSYLSPGKNRTQSPWKNLYYTKVVDDYPYLTDVFNEFKNIYFKNFNYDQVQMNKNYTIGKHRDKKNVGPSILCCFGDYTGGLTCVDYGNDIMKYDARREPANFDGSKYEHWVEEFKGTRYSLVFFRNNKKNELIN